MMGIVKDFLMCDGKGHAVSHRLARAEVSGIAGDARRWDGDGECGCGHAQQVLDSQGIGVTTGLAGTGRLGRQASSRRKAE
jgi:hypothetical protein